MTAPIVEELAAPAIRTFAEIAGEFFVRKGVPLQDVGHYVSAAAEQEGRRMVAGAPRNARRAFERMSTLGAETFNDTPHDAAHRLGLSIDLNGGFYHVKRDGKRLGSFANLGEARAFSTRAGKSPDVELTPSALPTSGLGGGFSHGGGQPPLVGEVLGGWYRHPAQPGQREGQLARVFDAFNIAFAPLASMRRVAQSFENEGFGKAFSRIFGPSQSSLDMARNSVNTIKRTGLGGLSFQGALDQLDKLRSGFALEENSRVMRLWEHATRQEIRDGLINGLKPSPRSIAFGDTILEHNKAPEIPRLFRKSVEYGRVRREPEYRRIRKAHGREMADAWAWVQLELDGDEVALVSNIAEILRQGPEKSGVNLTEAFAYARAPEMSREELARAIGATAEEVKAADYGRSIMAELGKDTGYDVDAQYRGFWPLVRELVREGRVPSDLKEHLPRQIDWTVSSFLHGEQELWRMNPTVNVAKYIRGAYMEKYFSPITRGIEKELDSMAKYDERAARIMGEYWREVRGMPHHSFDAVDKVANSVMKTLTGGKVSKGTTRELIDTLSGLGYSALIPFRLGLTLRNFASVLMILPRTGLDAWVAGIERGLSKEGYQRAVEAGAVKEGVLPFHQASGIFERNGIYLGQRKVWGQLGTRLTAMSKAGFKWYQKPDDLGRAIASEAQRYRIEKSLAKHGLAALGDTNSEAYRLFEREAGILTYNPLDVETFRTLWRQGNREQAMRHVQRLIADDVFFRYAGANHAPGWGSIAGRLLGQFGTWPVQYKDYLMQGLSRGTNEDKARFALWTAATNGALIYGAGAIGLNAQGWAPAMSLMYGGGPWAGTLVDVYQSIDGSPAEKAMARSHLGELVPMINPVSGEFDPTRVRSILVPYSGSVQDIINISQERDAYGALSRAVGFPRLPVEKPAE